MMTEKMKQKMEELIKEQTSAAIDACEIHGYPTSDEPLCLIVEDTVVYTFESCHAIMVEEQSKLEKQLVIAVDGLKKINSPETHGMPRLIWNDIAKEALKQIEEFQK